MAERTRWTRGLHTGLALVGLLIVVGLVADWLAPYSPTADDFGAAMRPPSASHWMGTDALGRDLASRVIHGSRVSLEVGLLTALFTLAVGIPVGAVAGYRGGWWDSSASRAIEALLCFPSILLVLPLLSNQSLLGGLTYELRIALVLGLTGWAPTARFLRAEFLKIQASDQVAAARALGARGGRIIVRHILPRAAAPVLVTAAFGVAAAILLEAALSFLGFGGGESVSWGRLLFDAQDHAHDAWWLALFPGAAVFLTTLGFNLVGEGLRDLLDPRTARR